MLGGGLSQRSRLLCIWKENYLLCHETVSEISILASFCTSFLPLFVALTLFLPFQCIHVSHSFLVPVIFAVTLSTSFIHSLLLILLLWTCTHISPTDCLSSIFCSTPHHNTNRWITFLAPELCTNISWLREQERIKYVNTRALQAIERISQSHTVSLVGIHHFLHPLDSLLFNDHHYGVYREQLIQ